MIVLRRNCLSLLEAKESSWSDDEDRYHQNKRKGEAPRRVQEEGYVLLDQSDNVGGYYCARHSNRDRKSTRLNSSHGYISYAVFCLQKKKNHNPLSALT